jgi:hypothetical protein
MHALSGSPEFTVTFGNDVAYSMKRPLLSLAFKGTVSGPDVQTTLLLPLQFCN